MKKLLRKVKQAWVAAELILGGLRMGHRWVLFRSLDGDEGRPDVLWLKHPRDKMDDGSLAGYTELFKMQCKTCGGWYEIARNHVGVVAHFCDPADKAPEVDRIAEVLLDGK